jgi:hypothetical protein
MRDPEIPEGERAVSLTLIARLQEMLYEAERMARLAEVIRDLTAGGVATSPTSWQPTQDAAEISKVTDELLIMTAGMTARIGGPYDLHSNIQRSHRQDAHAEPPRTCRH